jgi:hypothetical protein
MSFFRWTVISVATLGALALGGTAFAAAPPIRDHANLFSLATLSEANELAEAIQTNYDKRLVIETFSSVPWTARLTHNFKDPQDRARYFAEWAKRNARRAGANGIYVLICKQPAPVEVEVRVGRDTLPFFPLEDANRAREVLLADLRQGQPDTALLRSVRLIESRLEANGAHAPAPEEIFPWGRVLWSFLAIVVFWVLIELAHYLAIGRSRPGEAEAEPVGFGGGGSLPAGLFAAMTSHWLRDLWRRQPGPVTEPYLQAKRVPVEEANRDEAVAENHSNVAAFHAEELAGFDHQDTGHGTTVHDKP